MQEGSLPEEIIREIELEDEKIFERDEFDRSDLHIAKCGLGEFVRGEGDRD